MMNKNVVQQIRYIMPNYCYSDIKQFYERSNKIHSNIASDIVKTAILNNFEIEFKLDYKYVIPVLEVSIPIYIKYINTNNNIIADVMLDEENEILYVYINTYYKEKYINKYLYIIKQKLFYLEYCINNSIHIDTKAIYTKNLVNDICISEIDFQLIKKFILLLSPGEKEKRKIRVSETIKSLTDSKIDIICYGCRDIERICALLNYTADDNYYNMFCFFIYHFIDEDKKEIKLLFYLGYFLTKLNIKNFGIDKDYINRIKEVDYDITKFDMITAKNIYDFYDEFFNDYIYNFYLLIDKTITDKDKI